MSFLVASGLTAARIVVALSWAEIPVVIPSFASMETVKAVLLLDSLESVICFRPRTEHFSLVRVRQIKPLPCLAIKFTISESTLSAAQTRSPSFSLSSSSTIMTIFPSFRSSMISFVVFMIFLNKFLYYRH